MTATKPATVSCPKCGRQQKRRSDDAIYWCDGCRMQFDAEGDDGGDYSDVNPALRIEREERRRERTKGRRV